MIISHHLIVRIGFQGLFYFDFEAKNDVEAIDQENYPSISREMEKKKPYLLHYYYNISL